MPCHSMSLFSPSLRLVSQESRLHEFNEMCETVLLGMLLKNVRNA